jgi:ADP-ribosyl-[dinitrogen reductase] hydrolase
MADERALTGCLTGMAVGDALGLPHEGLSPRRARRLFPDVDHYYFLFRRGMFSDDTEHACMTAQALLYSGTDGLRFARSLAWRLRWWLLGCPLATGLATLKACLKLWLGFSPRNSGVRSTGNGPCMRAPILGVALGDRPELLREFVRRSTRMSHTDPRAEQAALAVAWAAYLSSNRVSDPQIVADRLVRELGDSTDELSQLIRRAADSAESGQPTEAFVADLGLARGVTGYVLHSVPVVIQAWLRFPESFASAVRSVIRCGGDTDTNAAIVGAIVGARVGVEGIPEAWITSLAEWPRNLRWIGRLGRELSKGIAGGRPRRTVPLNPIGILARNLLFAGTVFAHVLRRMLPPY